MSHSQFLLSETLKSVTKTKFRELEKRQAACQARKRKILDAIDAEDDLHKRVRIIHDSLKELKIWNDPDFDNIRRWTDQSTFDPTVSEAKIVNCERQLLDRLDIEDRKLALANIYSRLMIKCTDTKRSDNSRGSTPMSAIDNEDDSETFEVVQSAPKSRLEQLKQKFAKTVFEPFETDEMEIDLYLQSLFEGNEGVKALHKLRQNIKMITSNMKELVIDRQHLIWSIKALQRNELLSNDKKAILTEFLKDETVLNEIRDVINMRLQDIENWSWDLEDGGMPVVPRQCFNGKWRVMMDEDVMQALLTHFIGNTWAVSIKKELSSLVRQKGAVWHHQNLEPKEERRKRLFFSPDPYDGRCGTAESYRQHIFRNDFHLASLPSRFSDGAGGYDDDDDDDDDNVDGTSKSGKEIKQLLLRTLATEIHFRRVFDKEVAVVQSDFQWFGTAVPHSTVFATLGFIGFDDAALEFLRKFLEPPLDMLDGKPSRVRKRGLPLAHIFERICGEIILFFLDIAVNQRASMMLYRQHDDLWLVGQPEQCARAWNTMQDYAKLMGLELNKSKTGSVYLTFDNKTKVESVVKALPKGPVSMHLLLLDPVSGEWVINQQHVRDHVSRLSTQLANTDNVLDWIATWNSCVGRFFSYTFGDPAHCFGRRHLEAVLQVHKDMQRTLFDEGGRTGKNVVHHLKQMIASQLSVSPSSIPDTFIFLPETFGGLGLKNPFINFFLVREKLIDSPHDTFAQYLEDERKQYEEDKEAFSKLDDHDLRRRWKRTFTEENGKGNEDGVPALNWSQAKDFPSFEEHTRYREAVSVPLGDLYDKFLDAPEKDDISISKSVRDAIESMRTRSDRGTIEGNIWQNHELLWLLEYYRDDLVKDFGGIQCIERDFLPLGILHAVRQDKAIWQMVL